MQMFDASSRSRLTRICTSKRVNVLKTARQTDRRTNKHTDGRMDRVYRVNWPRMDGP